MLMVKCGHRLQDTMRVVRGVMQSVLWDGLQGILGMGNLCNTLPRSMLRGGVLRGGVLRSVLVSPNSNLTRGIGGS